jgi:hypothetical protein
VNCIGDCPVIPGESLVICGREQDQTPILGVQSGHTSTHAIYSGPLRTGPYRPSHQLCRLPLYTPLQVGASPISPVCFLCLGRARGFVSTSAVCSGSRQLSISISLDSTILRIQCHFVAMCFDFLWNWGFCTMAINLLLSPLMRLGFSCGKPSSW